MALRRSARQALFRALAELLVRLSLANRTDPTDPCAASARRRLLGHVLNFKTRGLACHFASPRWLPPHKGEMACFSPQKPRVEAIEPKEWARASSNETDAAKRLELLCATLDSIETNANDSSAALEACIFIADVS